MAGPPPEKTLNMNYPPWNVCQDWILASTPSSPSLMVSAASLLQGFSIYSVISYFTSKGEDRQGVAMQTIPFKEVYKKFSVIYSIVL